MSFKLNFFSEQFLDDTYRTYIFCLTKPHIFVAVDAPSRRTVKLFRRNPDPTRRWKTEQHHYHVGVHFFVISI